MIYITTNKYITKRVHETLKKPKVVGGFEYLGWLVHWYFSEVVKPPARASNIQEYESSETHGNNLSMDKHILRKLMEIGGKLHQKPLCTIDEPFVCRCGSDYQCCALTRRRFANEQKKLPAVVGWNGSWNLKSMDLPWVDLDHGWKNCYDYPFANGRNAWLVEIDVNVVECWWNPFTKLVCCWMFRAMAMDWSLKFDSWIVFALCWVDGYAMVLSSRIMVLSIVGIPKKSVLVDQIFLQMEDIIDWQLTQLWSALILPTST